VDPAENLFYTVLENTPMVSNTFSFDQVLAYKMDNDFIKEK
jgi:hypothetical protein